MDISTLLNSIKELYDKIVKIEDDTIHSLHCNGQVDCEERIPQEFFDFSEVYDELKRILYPMLEHYRVVFKSDCSEKAKKVYFIALCEMIKKDYTTGMVKTFKAVTENSYLDTNRYYDILQIVTESQGLVIKKKDNVRLFERTYIEETGIPQNLTRTVIKFFKTYWKYFRHIDVETRNNLISDYIFGDDFPEEYIFYSSDEKVLSNAQKELMVFPEKSIRTIKKLDDIFTALDDYDELYQPGNEADFIETISSKVGFDILAVLRNSDLADIYSKYLQSIPIYKFQKQILPNLPKHEPIVTPSGVTIEAAILNSNSLCCGIYKIRGISYEVVISPIISLEDIFYIPRNSVKQLASEYYIYTSDDYFDIETNGRTISPRTVILNNRSRYVWLDKIAAASSVYVDGHLIQSSERKFVSGKIAKRFNYETKKNELCYRLHCLKACYPEYKFKKMSYVTSSGESGLLCIGNEEGIFYIEDRCFVINDSPFFNIDFYIDDTVIHSETEELKENYLFDKWTGMEILSNKKNDKHSGALVYFTNTVDVLFEIDSAASYKWNNYEVFEFEHPEKLGELKIENSIYSFSKSSKPYFFIYGDMSYEYRTESLSNLKLKFCNLMPEQKYWFVAENKKIRERKEITCGEFYLKDIFQGDNLTKSGKWFFSLWERQHKIDEISVFVEPTLYIEQIDECTLEGFPVKVQVTASEDCFASEVGVLCNSTILNIGDAKLELDGETIVATELDNYIYLDSLGVMKKVQLMPRVWGVKTKDLVNHEWSNNTEISVDLDNVNQNGCAICANTFATIYVNEKQYSVVPGINTIRLNDFLYNQKRKFKLYITDNRQVVKIIIGCIPRFRLYDVKKEEDLIITIKYVGPVDESLVIRSYVEGDLHKEIRRTTTKNTFLIHFILGKAVDFLNKMVTVEAKDEVSSIPQKVFGDIVICEEKSAILKNDVENDDDYVENKFVFYQSVDSLLERYAQHKNIQNSFDDVTLLIQKLEK